MTVVGYCWYAGSSVGRWVNVVTVVDGGDGCFLGGIGAIGGPVVLCVFGMVRGV